MFIFEPKNILNIWEYGQGFCWSWDGGGGEGLGPSLLIKESNVFLASKMLSFIYIPWKK